MKVSSHHREPKYVELFLDNIGAINIDFGSVCCIYQLLNDPKTKIDGLGSSAEFLKSNKDTGSINLSKGEAEVYYSYQSKAPPIFGGAKTCKFIFPACCHLASGGIITSRKE